MVLCNIINSLTGFKFPYVKGLISFLRLEKDLCLYFALIKGFLLYFMLCCIYVLFINLVCRLIREIKFFSSSFVFFLT